MQRGRVLESDVVRSNSLIRERPYLYNPFGEETMKAVVQTLENPWLRLHER